MPTYIALLRKDESSDYGVDFPDLPGCVTAGCTLEEARRAAAEALALHFDGMMADGDPVPPSSGLDAVMSNSHNGGAVAFPVDAPVAPPRAVRVNVMLPEDLLQAIDRVTGNRSRFLADAARAKLRVA